MPNDPLNVESLAAQAEPLRAQLAGLKAWRRSFGLAMTTAFRRSVVDGKRLEDVLKSLALSLSRRALTQALSPIGSGHRQRAVGAASAIFWAAGVLPRAG